MDARHADDRLVQQTLFRQGDAESTMGLGELRPDRDGLPRSGDGLVESAGHEQRVSQINLCLAVIRPEMDGLTVGGDGLVKLIASPGASCRGYTMLRGARP